jgi:hypothetical protein
VYEYEALRIRLQPGEAGNYKVLASGPFGEVSGDFRLPFEGAELENFILRIGRPRRGVRKLGSPEMTAAQTLGSGLFDALFRENLRDLYHTTSAEADAAGKGLRITLLLGQAPELMNVPWEYMCDDGRFLSVSERTPIVRYLDLKKAHKPLPVVGPLKIVGMVSNPTDVAELDVEVEQRRLEAALEAPIRRGEIELVWLENATLSALHEALEGGDFHIFHYIGHGAFDEQAGDGVLILEDERGRARPVTGTYLGQLMADERTLQLAVLNACEGARASAEDAFAGVATSLVKSEIPSVIAMQFEITDDAAILFAGGFYSALARGAPVDAALATARKAIWANYNDIEWGTPVLFMRVPDGRIFDVTVSPEVEAEEAKPKRAALELALAARPEVVEPDGDVTWTLTVENTGEAPLSDVSALGPDGAVVLEPSELAPGQSVRCNWPTRPSADVEMAVTVSAADPSGNRLTEQATARVSVRTPEPPVVGPVRPTPPRPVTPGGDVVLWWRRPRYALALLGLVLATILLAVVVLSRGDDGDGGNGGGGGGGESYADVVRADGPVLYWRLDEEDGDTAADASDSAGDGTYEGVSLGEESFLAGSTAAGFDGSSYVRGPELDLASGPFTVELWAKHTGRGEQHNIFSQGTDRGNEGLHLAFTATDEFKCDFYNNPFRTLQAYPDDGWHHWACTYDPASDTRRLYRDGRPVGARIVPGGSSGPYAGEGDVLLGAPPWAGPGFVGLIDEVAVYDGVLSRDQLRAHYEARQQS